MTKLIKTTDYSIFKKHMNNRQIDALNLKKIIHSIKTQNMLEFRPILVDEDMCVIDGQHRLEAAKQLNIPVYYQMNEKASHEDIVLLNSHQKIWTTEEYISYYISRGNQEYKRLQDYAIKRKMGVAAVLSLCRGDRKVNAQTLKKGTFKFFDSESLAFVDSLLDKIEKINELLIRYVIVDNKFLNSTRFKNGLLAFLKNPQVDFDIFLEKLTCKADQLRQCSDVYTYYCMLRDVYNWKNPNPVE